MRLVNRLASALLGLALVAAGVLVVVEVILAAFGRPALLLGRRGGYASLVDARLDDERTVLVALGVGLLGLVILVAELLPRRATRLPATVDRGWFLRRRAVEQRIDRAASTEPDVANVRTAIRRRRGRWLTTVTVSGDRAPESAVRDRARQVLTRLTAPDGPIRVVRRSS
jgi:hypothetical protein